MTKAISIGEALIDFSPAGTSEKGMPLYEMNPGGACANVACVLAKFGIETSFIGKVGSDAFGTFLKQQLKEQNVDTSAMVFDKEVDTTLAFVHLAESGDRSFSFVRKPGAETCLQQEEVPRQLLADCDLIHFGAFSLTGNPSRDTMLEIARGLKEEGKIVSFDPNLRLQAWENPELAKATMMKGLTSCNILKVSEEELYFLTNIENIEGACEAIYNHYNIPVILATLGKNGVYYKTIEESGLEPTYQEIETIDTTGAGDCFIGSFLYQASLYGLDNLKGDNLKSAIDFSNAAASLSTAVKGAIPSIPDLETVRKLTRFQG